MRKKDYSWNPGTCICDNDKYLKNIADTSVIACDGIIYVIDTVSTKITIVPKPLRIRSNIIDGFVRTYGGNRYLTLFSSENYDAIYNGIRYFLWGFTILHTHPLPATLTHSHYISPTLTIFHPLPPTFTHSHSLSPTPTLFATLIHFQQIVGNEI